MKWTNSIAFRLSASIAVVVLATALTITSFILRDEQKTLENRLHIRSLQLGEIMSRQMIEPLLYDELYTIYTLFESYIKTADSIIVYAEAYDEKGQFLLDYTPSSQIEKITVEPSSFSQDAGFLGHTQSFESGEIFDLIYPIKTQQLGLIGYLRLGITPLQLLNSLKNIQQKVFILTALITLSGILAGLWMARKILKPILVLNRAVLQIEGENLGAEIDVAGIGEVRELTSSFNKMSRKLKESMETMKTAQDSLIRKEKLYVLGEFSASLAHEIKNPLTPIKMLIQRAHDEDESLEVGDLEIINDELKRIDKIVSQFLSYARITEPHLENIDINLLIQDVLVLSQRKIKNSKIELILDFSSSPLMVHANPDSLKQVMINLLLNAIQAMPGGGTLKLTTRGEEDGIKVEINDSGIGMTAEQLEKAFDPFFTTKQDGTGLGLSIILSIIENHHGTIDLFSGANQGTRVLVRIPYA